MKKRGIIAQIEDGFCFIVSKDGTFDRIPLPAEGARVGQEITYSVGQMSATFKSLVLAAACLLVFFSYALFQQNHLPQAIAYVAVDINTGLELAVDKDLKVVSFKSYDENAANLLQDEDIIGQNIYVALNNLAQKAVGQHYLATDQDNLIVSTVAADPSNTRLIDNEKIQQSLEGALQRDGIDAQVRIYSLSSEMHEKAEKMGISPARLILYEQIKASGQNVNIDDIKASNITELSREYNIELPPNTQESENDLDYRSNNSELLPEGEGPTLSPRSAPYDRDEDLTQPAVRANETGHSPAGPGPNGEEGIEQTPAANGNESSYPPADSGATDDDTSISPPAPPTVDGTGRPPAAPEQTGYPGGTEQPSSSMNGVPSVSPTTISPRGNGEVVTQPSAPTGNATSNPAPSPGPKR